VKRAADGLAADVAVFQAFVLGQVILAWLPITPRKRAFRKLTLPH